MWLSFKHQFQPIIMDIASASIDELLPKTLRNTLVLLFEDNVLINYRIFGGETTTISMKFESQEPTAAEPIIHDNHNKPTLLSYRRKSPSNMNRDLKRLGNWKSRSSAHALNSIQDNNNNSDMHSGNVSDLMVGDCSQVKCDDSGFVNSTPLPCIDAVSSKKAKPVKKCDIDTQVNLFNTASTDTQVKFTSGDDCEVQTDSPELMDKTMQTDLLKSKKVQTKCKNLAAFDKALQTIPTVHSNCSQTANAKYQGIDKAAMTHETIKTSVTTETMPAPEKHTQTFIAQSHPVAIQASEKFTKSTQTLSKRELKSLMKTTEAAPQHCSTSSKQDAIIVDASIARGFF